ncbi:hypothetical protein AgCh_015622 [Apium graveolens]
MRHFTAPSTPQQNIVVERRNRTMIEMARSMLNGITLKEDAKSHRQLATKKRKHIGGSDLPQKQKLQSTQLSPNTPADKLKICGRSPLAKKSDARIDTCYRVTSHFSRKHAELIPRKTVQMLKENVPLQNIFPPQNICQTQPYTPIGKKAIELEHDPTEVDHLSDFNSDVSERIWRTSYLKQMKKLQIDWGAHPVNVSEDPPYDINNDNEFSYIAGMHSDQSDGDSEAEMDEDVHIPSYEDMSVVDTGPANVKCSYCDAWMWKEKCVNKSVVRGTPVFSLCCVKGQIKLPKEPPTPSFIWKLHTDKVKGQRFKDGMRLYNSIFAFTSTGGRVDNSINNGGAPYIYRLNGQNHHLFGSLIPPDGEDPKFFQLYIYDTENEISNWLRWVNVDGGDPVDVEIVEGLSAMLDETNKLVKEFCTAHDRFESDDVQDLEIRLKVCRAENGRENHVGPSDEVSGIMVGDIDDTDGSRDIIIHSHIQDLERISDIHPKLMALQYPLLSPHGGDGFHKKIPFGKVDNKS